MKATLTATLIAALATPVMAGGPVIIDDTTEVVAEKPASSIGILPILLVLAVGIALTSSGNDSHNECSHM